MTEVPETLQLAAPEQAISLLLGVIEATAAGPEVEPLAGAVARLISEATATDACFVHVLDDSGTSLTLAGATPPFDEHVGTVRLPLGSGVSGWVAAHREPAVIVEDKPQDARYIAFPALRGEDFVSMASVPMTSELAGLVGVLNVHTRERREFTSRDVQLLLTIGNLVAAALHQARLHRRLAARERAHERFAERVVAAQESERRRLAGDLHDGVTQRLVSLIYYLDAAEHAPHEDAVRQLRHAHELAELSLDEARAAIGGLRPPVLDDLGLAGGLASLASSFPGVEVTVRTSSCRLPDHVEIALFRVAQEALHNVAQHAAARTASVSLVVRPDDRAELRIRDDGCGFDPPPADEHAGGYGLTSMNERVELVGGTLRVSSRPGGGTVVEAVVPLGGTDGGWPGSATADQVGRRDRSFLP
ncbi:GAF domain-containing sensor histidine kinase [Pseudonocardia sp. C8]|uniref:GAF domain-containing sensor histidine kinase n=1 Tax=Pseudonocardia sp. C8 TaxID=2762759 RepID=UPI001643461F|nr:GAF domain-containing sensor histidine kinase [Pseudonocardia sp. C8]MBC3190411.1 GAF domain-containing sensor histidine kinase [Pseudonocardia sp. C8]